MHSSCLCPTRPLGHRLPNTLNDHTQYKGYYYPVTLPEPILQTKHLQEQKYSWIWFISGLPYHIVTTSVVNCPWDHAVLSWAKKKCFQGFGRERGTGACCSAYSLPQFPKEGNTIPKEGNASDYKEAGIDVWLGKWLSLWAIMEEKKKTSLFWDGVYQRVSSRTLPRNAWSWAHFSPRPDRSWAEVCKAANSGWERDDKELKLPA